MTKRRNFLSVASKIVLSAAILVFLVSLAWAANGFKPGKIRWPIKTSVPQHANLKKPRPVSFSDLIALEAPPDVGKNDKRYQSKLIPEFKNSLNLKEGDIIAVTGWLHLVAAETDGDYHIQISGSRFMTMLTSEILPGARRT